MFKNRVTSLLQKVTADVVLITAPENMRYYSGFTGGEGAIVLQSNHCALLTDSRYFIQAKEESSDFTIVDITKTPVSDYLKDCSPSVLGYEENFLSVKFAKELAAALPDSQWLGVDGDILMQRAVKDEGELALIRRAARLADEAFAHVLPLLRPGVCELDIALELEWVMRKGGATGPSFPIICASGHRSAMPHGVASNKQLAPGDFVTMDFGCFFEGYASDMTRTVVLGKATDEQKAIYETVLSAQKAALDFLCAGVTGKEADASARSVIDASGYGCYFSHSLGHGVGLFIHEQPNLSPRSDTRLQPGMAVTVEPGIYIEQIGGVRIEDLVIITDTGCENLTQAEKTLLEL